MEPDQRETDTPQGPEPPAGSGIAVEGTDDGVRVTLPRLYTRVDLVIVGVSAAIAAFMGVWIGQTDAGTGPGLLAMAFAGAIGLFFGWLAVSEGLAIAAPRVIEDAGDAIVLGRKVGVRHVPGRWIRKADIREIHWTWTEEEPGVVEIRTQGRVHRLGEHLDVASLEWLEGAVRAMVERGDGTGNHRTR